MDKYTFILDCDGVLTNGSFLYDINGKAYKIYGPDDADALKLIKPYLNDIVFVSQDKRGYQITEKRITDMGFKLYNIASKDRTDFIAKNYGLNNSIYMGDSFVDAKTLKACKYGITTCAADNLAKKYATYTTKVEGGHRAVAEACFWILENILKLDKEEVLGLK